MSKQPKKPHSSSPVSGGIQPRWIPVVVKKKVSENNYALRNQWRVPRTSDSGVRTGGACSRRPSEKELALRLLGMSWGVKTTCLEAPGVSLGGSGVSIGGVGSLRVNNFLGLFPDKNGGFPYFWVGKLGSYKL